MTLRGPERVTPADGTANGPYIYGWQQPRIFDNARKRDRATPRGGRSPSGCKLLLRTTKFIDEFENKGLLTLCQQ
ncbi:MAG: hypothetical protein G01um101417_454 [Parcubacteria group bacterium Gr01-1014_17]|nr:MAG: hypothetical protein G01um101417_454 [Parcubacteria group bacterium Gr01-1014_17]